MPNIFISYRRKDSGTFTGRIHDKLEERFGDKNVFRDVYDIPAGSDFRTVLEKEIDQCDTLLAIIGPQWENITDDEGNPRLNDPNDFVRIEVEAALKSQKARVIPVLVDNASMPSPDNLPESLKELCFRNAVVVRTDPDFPRDMEALIRQLESFSPLSRVKKWGKMIAVAMLVIMGAVFFANIKNIFNSSLPPTQDATPFDSASIEVSIPSPEPIVPVQPGQVMVLVAQMEQIGSEERDVTRFIVDDLIQHLEVELPFTNIAVREYEGIISSSSDALQIAEQAQAVIVIWGYYDDDNTITNIQLGSLESRSNLVLERELLERTVNVRAKIVDERQETLAYQILSSLGFLYGAENDPLEMSLLFMALDMLNTSGSEMIGSSNATHVHTAMKAYLSYPQLAVDEMNQAIELDAGNPLLYLFHGLLHQRMGDFDLATQDSDTALLLAPDNWIMPYLLKGNRSLIEFNPIDGIENYSEVIERIPNDWYAYNMRGYSYFLSHEYDLAREDIDKAIELDPDAEYPYMWAALIALRQGDLGEASNQMGNLLSEQPDPVFVNRYMTAVYGKEFAQLLGNSMAAMGHLILGQYNIVIQDTYKVLEIAPTYPEMYLLQGLSYCNLDDYISAEEAYTQGVELDPSFTLLYLLRAEARSKLGDAGGATEDFYVVQESAIAEQLNPYILAAQTGEFSCKTLFGSE